MLAGLQGAGKTTLAGKLGHWLKDQGHTPLLVACDLQRPNAVDQLTVVASGPGCRCSLPHPGVSASGALATPQAGPGDPVAVAAQGVAYAVEKQYDVVIVDTAGRLGVDTEMMRQAADIRDAVHPDEILFVLDAMIGQDAVTTAQAFAEGVGFTGVVLSKLDGDARGGAALSVVGGDGQAGDVRVHGGEARRVRAVPPRPHGVADPRHGRRAHPDRAGPARVRRGPGREDGGQVRR